MALIQCPECGQTISDRAEKCPKCGYPITPVEKEAVIEPAAIVSEQPVAQEKNKKKIIILMCLVVLAVAIGVGLFFAKGLFGTVTVSEIKIAKWKVTDTTSYGNYYEATVTSEQKKPFVAVIGSYDDEDKFPRFAFVNNGEGKIEIYASDDDDPSVEYHPIGYYQAEEIKSSELSLKYKDRDYDDWSFDESTHCYVDIEVKLNSNRSGFLLVDVENITNKETDYSLRIPIINGEGKYSYYAELPYKSRGIEITVSPVCFVKSKPLTETDYSIDKAFSVKKEEGKYTSSYDGEGVWTFTDFDDGLILYTMELTDGGDKTDRGEVNNLLAFLHDHEITITSYDRASDGVLMPKYDIKLIGYLPWTELTKE